MTGSKSRARTRPRSSTSAPATNPATGATVGSGGGNGGKVAPTGCEDLSEVIILMSPDPTVLATINPHDELSVERRGRPVVAVHRDGVAGSVVPNDLIRLIACLDQGFKFGFTVLSIEGSQCRGALRCLGR